MRSDILFSIDYYILLGITPDADMAQIEEAYTNLIKCCLAAYHSGNPILKQQAEWLVGKVHEAYATLSDGIERWRYDEHLRAQMEAEPRWEPNIVPGNGTTIANPAAQAPWFSTLQPVFFKHQAFVEQKN